MISPTQNSSGLKCHCDVIGEGGCTHSVISCRQSGCSRFLESKTCSDPPSTGSCLRANPMTTKLRPVNSPLPESQKIFEMDFDCCRRHSFKGLPLRDRTCA